MKKTFGFVIFLAVLAGLALAENAVRLHPWLRPMALQSKLELTSRLRGDLGGRQGRLQLDGAEALSLVVRTSAQRSALEAPGIHVRSLVGGIATLTVLPGKLKELASRPDVFAITLPHRVYPNRDLSMLETGMAYLRTQSGGVFSGLTGAGVLVGVVDSGIDFDHPDFRDSAGRTRIRYLWDQNVTGTPPSGYSYGQEWTSTDIDGGVCTEEDEFYAWGHGTHVTGIAAGNGAAPDSGGVTYATSGAAPDSGIIFVKTNWMTDGIVDALSYIFDQADALGLPCVVNLSLGSHFGAHDGTDPMEEAIDTLVTAEAGRAVVVAAGNEGADNIHAQVSARAAMSVVGPRFEIPDYTPAIGSGNDYVYLVGYYPEGDDLTVHLFSPGGLSYEQDLSATSGPGASFTEDMTGADGAVCVYNFTDSILDQGTSYNEIVIAIYDDSGLRPPAEGTWSLAFSGNTVTGSGEVNLWMLSSVGGETASFTSDIDAGKTVGIPGTSREAITVGAYLTRICWDDSSGDTWHYGDVDGYDLGDIASFSSRGPTLDGRSKPELAAPGMGIVSCLAQEIHGDMLADPDGQAFVVDQYHMLMQGTSQAAPQVAGAVALIMQSDPTLTGSQIKSLLQDYARPDGFTDNYDTTWLGLTRNYTFGSGKLDLLGMYTNEYENNNTYSTARPIISGETVVTTLYLDYDNDVDYYHLEDLANGDRIDVTLTDLSIDDDLVLFSTSVESECGGRTENLKGYSANYFTDDENISYTVSTTSAVEPSLFYVEVRSGAGCYDSTGTYTLKSVLTRPETSSSNGTIATAQQLPVFIEMNVTGNCSTSTDKDFYRIGATTGEVIEVGYPTPSATVKIYNSSGTCVASSTPLGTGTLRYTVPSTLPLVTGRKTYYVSIEPRIAAKVFSYTLNVQIQ